MTVREIQGHLAELYGAEASPDLISRVADAGSRRGAGMAEPAARSGLSGGVFDALRVKIRDEGLVRNKAVALNPDGEEVLGLWIEPSEGAKFRLKAVNELKARGVNDILIAVVDVPQGLRGDRLGLPGNRRPDLNRAPDQEQPGVRFLDGPQGPPARRQGDLSGRQRRHRARPVGGVRD